MLLTKKNTLLIFHAHNSYSQIDYLLLSQSLVSNETDSIICNIILSEHAPLLVLFAPIVTYNKTKQWRFNNSLLKDKKKKCVYDK